MDSRQNLINTINIEKWQKLQDALAEVTEMAIITTDYRGIPVSEHSGCKAFCKNVRENPELRAICEKCDSRGGLEAMRLKVPYIYLCHFDILDAAIPIIVDGAYLGAILIGQVILSDLQSSKHLEKVCSSGFDYGEDTHMQYLHNSLPRISYDRVKVIVNMLYHLCNYFVGDATEKKTILRMLSNNPDSNYKVEEYRITDDSKLELHRLLAIKADLNNLITETRFAEKEVLDDLPDDEINDPLIKKVSEYLNLHKAERCSLADMAKLCHITPSYFSRLFKKVTGENYSAFLFRKRVEWGKKLLLTTDLSMSQIAEEVGFSDAGHFVRSFKKQEGISPAFFRKNVISE